MPTNANLTAAAKVPIIGKLLPDNGTFMLATFLLTPKQQRIFAPLMMRPEHAFSLSDLLDAAGGGRSSVQSYIQGLVGAGVVQVDRCRKAARYHANTKHPLYPELHSIAVKSFGVREPLIEGLQPFANAITYAFVFGSLAKGTAHSNSDIDLMVIGDVRAYKIEAALQDVQKQMGRPIHVNAYLSVEWDELRKNDPVVRAIAEGPKIELIST